MKACAASLLLAASAAFAGDNHKVQKVHVDIRDYCDPVTFAQIGCNRPDAASNGFITFAGFGAELAADKSVGAWRYAPDSINGKEEEKTKITATNVGGEGHTFTRVKKFGGGFVAALNAGSGNNTPAPECASVVNNQLVPNPNALASILGPGQSTTAVVGDDDKDAKFQCCIHPWMRATVNHDGHHD
jgi:hypothetical protein